MWPGPARPPKIFYYSPGSAGILHTPPVDSAEGKKRVLKTSTTTTACFAITIQLSLWRCAKAPTRGGGEDAERGHAPYPAFLPMVVY